MGTLRDFFGQKIAQDKTVKTVARNLIGHPGIIPAQVPKHFQEFLVGVIN